LKLRYTDLLKNAPADSAATLSASVSKDQQEVLSKRDKEAVIFGARAQSAWNTQRAAEALERGDLPRAKRYLKVSEGILADAEGGVPGGSLGVVLSEGREEQKKLFNAVSAPAASPEQISDQVKAAKSSALKGMGHIGSTY